ncbi:unnamed protein product [Ambrosiozyma monospora]|uniref:DNA repair and recombination protein RAD52 n=1 Tax=Ambrosiozyma monospora TaxID=43982 RepID=A0A9W6YUA8_AMBMO|nr:unnamed protein product [Ambrosiozyma monospora]
MSRSQLTTIQQYNRSEGEFRRRLTVEEQFEIQLKNDSDLFNQLSKKEADFEWFPNTDNFELEIMQAQYNNETYMRPASWWSVERISKFHGFMEKLSNEEQSHRTRTFGNYQFDKLSTNKLIQGANTCFGFTGWKTDVDISSAKATRYDKREHDEEDGRPNRYTIELSIDVKIRLIDGTVVVKTGKGRADNQPSRALAFSKARKEAVTDGIRNCLYGLIELIAVYEENVRAGITVKCEDS